MKTRPIGTIVARDPTCNILLELNVQDPQKGSAMQLGDDLSKLSDERLAEIKTFLQAKMDDACTGLARMIQEAPPQEHTTGPEQAVLDLEPVEDDLEIPPFFRRNTQ